MSALPSPAPFKAVQQSLHPSFCVCSLHPRVLAAALLSPLSRSARGQEIPSRAYCEDQSAGGYVLVFSLPTAVRVAGGVSNVYNKERKERTLRREVGGRRNRARREAVRPRPAHCGGAAPPNRKFCEKDSVQVPITSGTIPCRTLMAYADATTARLMVHRSA